MTTIKYLSRLSTYFAAPAVDLLEIQAKKLSTELGLTFRVVEVSPLSGTTVLSIRMETEQQRINGDQPLDATALTQFTRAMFDATQAFKDIVISVRAVTYNPSIIDRIDAQWVADRLRRNEVTIKNITDDTGIDKTNLSAWVCGSRPMSQPVKALMYYYFKCLDQLRYTFTNSEIQELRETIGKLEAETLGANKKKIRHQLRTQYGFYISEFKASGEDFTRNDFDNLLKVGRITAVEQFQEMDNR